MGEVSQHKDTIGSGRFGLLSKEQITPADAVLAEEKANEVSLFLFNCHSRWMLTRCVVLQILDPAITPLGIVTLEDVLKGTYVALSLSSLLTLGNRADQGRDL
jgi:hypothetical protein